jgi:predicted DNA binding CopG/RHH family protein
MKANWVSSKGKRGMYKYEIRIRVPREIRKLVEKRANERSMSLAEYVRYLIHKDLEGVYGETWINP